MEIVPTTIHHLLELNETISQDDLIEFEKYKKHIMKDESIILLDHLIQATSDYVVFTMIHDLQVMAIGGEFAGCVWFLTSTHLEKQTKKIKKEFIIAMNNHKEQVLDNVDYIWNFIWEGNTNHINFLKMLGAEFPLTTDIDIPTEFKLFIIRRK